MLVQHSGQLLTCSHLFIKVTFSKQDCSIRQMDNIKAGLPGFIYVNGLLPIDKHRLCPALGMQRAWSNLLQESEISHVFWCNHQTPFSEWTHRWKNHATNQGSKALFCTAFAFCHVSTSIFFSSCALRFLNLLVNKSSLHITFWYGINYLYVCDSKIFIFILDFPPWSQVYVPTEPLPRGIPQVPGR